MTLRSKLGWTAAALFAVINLAGAGYAIALGEGPHAATHVALLLIQAGAFAAWRWKHSAQRQHMPKGQADARLEYLQQSIDAVAIEVERIGEAQRFGDKLRVQKGEASPLNKAPSD